MQTSLHQFTATLVHEFVHVGMWGNPEDTFTTEGYVRYRGPFGLSILYGIPLGETAALVAETMYGFNRRDIVVEYAITGGRD